MRGRQLTRTLAGPFPERAVGLSGTDIVSESESPPPIFGVRTIEVPTTPLAVLITARQAPWPPCAESLATTKLTLAFGEIPALWPVDGLAPMRTEVTEYDGFGGPTARMATQVPIDPITTVAAVTIAMARTTLERR